MREYKDIAKDYLNPKLKPWRTEHKHTQEKMAEMLRMSPRSYADLEREESGFSATTLLLFLALLSDDEMIDLVQEFYRQVVQREKQKLA